MALTIFEVIVAAGLVFQVAFLIALFRDRTQQACVIDTVTEHDAEHQAPPQSGEQQHSHPWQRAAMFILPLFLLPTGLRAQAHPAGKLIPVDVQVESARQCR